jgi:hypothetical protein
MEIEIRRHAIIVERLDMWRNSSISTETIHRRRLNTLKEMFQFFIDLLII